MNFYKNFSIIYKFLPKAKLTIIFIILLQILVGLFESLSIISLLPLVAFFVGDEYEKSILIIYVQQFFDFFHIPFSLISFVLFTLILITFKCIFLFLDQMFIAYTIENSLFKIREKFIRTLPKLDWNIIQKLKTGYLTSQLQLEIERIGKALRSSLHAIGFFFFLLFYLLTALIISYEVTLAAVVVGLIKVYFLKSFKKRSFLIGKEFSRVNTLFSSTIIECFQNIKSTIAMGKQNFFFKKIYKSVSFLRKVHLRASLNEILFKNIDEIFTTIIICAILIIMVNFFSVGIVEIGLVIIIINRALNKLAFIQKTNLVIAGNWVAVQNINKLFNSWKTFLIKEGKKKLDFKKRIRYKEVDIVIGRKIILKNLNLTILKNKLHLIQGRSGIGKSTLVETLLGFRLPNSGKILFDNIEIDENINFVDWCKNIGYVPQDSSIFGETILESLKLGEKNIDQKKINNALKISESLEFINKLPKKLNTNLLEKGNNFSVGQLQRLAIARALIHAKKLLILDEATANLDKEVEEKIMKKLKLLSKKITIVLVSHHQYLTKYVDRVIKL